MSAAEYLAEVKSRADRLAPPDACDCDGCEGDRNVVRLVDALSAVLVIHARRTDDDPEDSWCDTCGEDVWPCFTVRAITDALGVTP